MNKFFKKIAVVLAMAMVFTAMPMSVFAEEAAVAKIGETEYATFEAALNASKEMTGDVTVEVYDKVTLNSNLSGSYNSIKFIGKGTNAGIKLDVQGYITAAGKKVSFEGLTLSKSAGGFINNAGFMNVAFGVYDVTEVTYKNCTFANGAYASSGKVTYTNCTFMRSHDKYGLWAYGNVDVVVDGCKFDDYRGIKMYAEGAAKTVDLTVKNSDFSAVNDKPAIVLTYGERVVLENNTYSATGVFELDLGGSPNGTPVTSDIAPTCKNDKGACGVLVDGKIYTTVAQAAQVATSGSKVTLLHDSTETVELPAGVTLDKNGHTANGVTVKKTVAKIGETEYATLAEAVAAVPADNTETTIELLKNCSGGGVAISAGHNIVFDLKGHEYTVGEPTVGSTGTETNGFQLLKGNTIKFKDGTIKAADHVDLKIVFQNYCDLTLENVTVDASKDTHCRYVISSNNGNVNLIGNTSVYAYPNQNALDAMYWPNNGYTDGGIFTVDTTGTISGLITYGSDGTNAGKAGVADKVKLVLENGTFINTPISTYGLAKNGKTGITINGGTFNKEPKAAYIADGYEYKASGSNYIVGEHKLVSVAGTSATCTASGTKAHEKCDFCGKLYINGAEVTAADLVIAATGHTKAVKNNDAAAHFYHCSVCGTSLGEEAHTNDASGNCTICGWHTAPVATPAPTVAPTATPKPTTTPEATTTPAPTTTPEPTTAPVEMPKEADTTVVEVKANETVVEKVKETVTVTEGTATVDKAAVEAIVEATTEEETAVVIPLTQVTSETEVVNKAEVDTEALTTVAEAEKDVVIELTDVTVKLDAEAIKAVTEQANGATIEIRAVKAETHTLTETQQAALADKETAIVVTAQIFSDGEYIGDFKGGKATVMLPFAPEEGKAAEDYKVYFLDDNGELHEVASEYVNGHMVFTTAHFSDYVIVYEKAAVGGETDVVVTPETPAETTGSFPVLPIVIVIAIVVLGAVVILKKRKAE